MHQTMVTSSTRRKSQSKPTPTSSYSDSKKGYPDNDRNRCFIRHLLGSFLCNNGTVTSWICAKQGNSIFSLVIGLLQWHQSLLYFAFSANFRNGLKHLFGNIHVFPPRSERIELQQIWYL